MKFAKMCTIKRYQILFFCVFSFYFFISSVNRKVGEKQLELDISLTDASHLNIKGTHRFVEIAGITGLNVKSVNTKAFVETKALNSEMGTLSVWMSPLEDMDKSAPVGTVKDIMTYPSLSDFYPPRKTYSSNFSIYYQRISYPRVIALFTNGDFWCQFDYGLAPFVYAEELPMQKGQWYHFVITWDKPNETLKMYINGQMAGHNLPAKSFKNAGDTLYIGNPFMVVSKLSILPEILNKMKPAIPSTGYT